MALLASLSSLIFSTVVMSVMVWLGNDRNDRVVAWGMTGVVGALIPLSVVLWMFYIICTAWSAF